MHMNDGWCALKLDGVLTNFYILKHIMQGETTVMLSVTTVLVSVGKVTLTNR